jgi:hypothetical protein
MKNSTKTNYKNKRVDNIEYKCPICKKDIIISHIQIDFACIDKNCPLGHGVKRILPVINDICFILNNLSN